MELANYRLSARTVFLPGGLLAVAALSTCAGAVGGQDAHEALVTAALSAALLYVVWGGIVLRSALAAIVIGCLAGLASYLPAWLYSPRGSFLHSHPDSYPGWMAGPIAAAAGCLCLLVFVMARRRRRRRPQAARTGPPVLVSSLSVNGKWWAVVSLVVLLLYQLLLCVGFTYGAVHSPRSLLENAVGENRAFGYELAETLSAFLSVVAGGSFVFWAYQSHRNLRQLNARSLRFTPGWAAGHFFIPVLNLARVPQVIAEIWKASDPRPPETIGYSTWRDVPGIVLLWWSVTIASAALQPVLMLTAIGIKGKAVFMLAARWYVLAVATVFHLVLVIMIGRRQKMREMIVRGGT